MSQASVLRAYDEIATFFSRGPSQEEIAAFHLSDGTIERIRDLLEKSSAATLTTEETEELDEVGHLNRVLLLIRSRIQRPGTIPAASEDTASARSDDAAAPDGAR
ncbi:MAG: hypothetical protein ACHQ4H_00295 [Ktedonobacterales bacterium]